MANTTMRIDRVIVRQKDGHTRVFLTLDYLGEDEIDFDDELTEGNDLNIELPSTTPPV